MEMVFDKSALWEPFSPVQPNAWFAPLVEISSPLLEDFPDFLAELEATFGETDRRRTTLNKIYALEQGSRVASVL